MLKYRYTDRLCAAAMALAVIICVAFMFGKSLGLERAGENPDYASALFDTGRVHTMDLCLDDWEDFIDCAPDKEYRPCTVVIDGEEFYQVGLRAKGNNSLRLTEEYGLSRYSLKLEFDHYVDGASYHGLDKFSLDASFQDNSRLKAYIAYDMMRFMGVPSPLCSFVWVEVNGEPWGLFTAIEEPEEAFARRNFGSSHGKLYKPDYRSLADENADIALKYVGDDPESYDNIFRNAKFKITDDDKARLISALRVLSTGENLDTAVDIDEVLRYFAVRYL